MVMVYFLFVLRSRINDQRQIKTSCPVSCLTVSCCIPCYLVQAANEYDFDLINCCDQVDDDCEVSTINSLGSDSLHSYNTDPVFRVMSQKHDSVKLSMHKSSIRNQSIRQERKKKLSEEKRRRDLAFKQIRDARRGSIIMKVTSTVKTSLMPRARASLGGGGPLGAMTTSRTFPTNLRHHENSANLASFGQPSVPELRELGESRLEMTRTRSSSLREPLPVTTHLEAEQHVDVIIYGSGHIGSHSLHGHVTAHNTHILIFTYFMV